MPRCWVIELLALLDGKSWIMKTAKLDESLRDAHCAALRLQQSGNISKVAGMRPTGINPDKKGTISS